MIVRWYALSELELGFLILPMSDLYTSLHISPKKKRFLSDDEDDTSLTPKRLRPAYVKSSIIFFRRFPSDLGEVRSRLQRRSKQTGPRLAVPQKPSLIPHFLSICHDFSRFRLPCNMLFPMPWPRALSLLLPKLGFCEMW